MNQLTKKFGEANQFIFVMAAIVGTLIINVQNG